MSVELNLTHEFMREDNKQIDELYTIHENTSKTLENIFKGKIDNSYKKAADATDVYLIASSQAMTLIDKIQNEAQSKVDTVKAAFYDKDMKSTKPFRHLSEIQDWANYLLETNESIAIEMLKDNLNIRRAAIQYASLYNDEETLDIREITLRAFEDLYEEEITAPRKLQEALPILKQSFTGSLEDQFTLESKHTYDESKEILDGRV